MHPGVFKISYKILFDHVAVYHAHCHMHIKRSITTYMKIYVVPAHLLLNSLVQRIVFPLFDKDIFIFQRFIQPRLFCLYISRHLIFVFNVGDISSQKSRKTNSPQQDIFTQLRTTMKARIFLY
jgi:hypothetical protein